MTDFSVPRNIRLSFSISIILLLITLGLALYSLNRLIAKADWVEHTNLVLLKLENILSLLKDAEVGQRGYLLTEDTEFLEPYLGSYYRTIKQYKEVRSLTIDNLSQQKKLDTLNQLIHSRFKIINHTLDLGKAGKLETAKSIVMTKEGKVLMDKIRALVKRMQNEELRLKEIRYDQVKTSSFLTPILILTATFFSFLISILAYWVTRKEIRTSFRLQNQLELTNQDLKKANQELIQAENFLKQVNNTLETRVEERTLHLLNSKEELNKINQELFRKNENLRRVNSDLDSFIYTASHELKAPITNIEAIISLLKEGICYEDPDTRNLIDRISSSGEKLKNVIEDLAVVVRVQNDIDSTQELIDVKKTVQEISSSINDLIKASNAQIKMELAPRAQLIFSKKNFRSILFNLIHNAIQYRSPDKTPEILIKLEKVPDYTLLTVKDNGIGIAPSKKENIFELFKRLHDHVEGSGIGLFIVKRIIDNAGGKIEIDSQINEGTTFRLYFPA
ncbi:MAG: CHASE3 domain-containing protein [Bacteroidota bacterium]|nr:CHASE3 domain-containing protein [Bacteroidota bacterium]